MSWSRVSTQQGRLYELEQHRNVPLESPWPNLSYGYNAIGVVPFKGLSLGLDTADYAISTSHSEQLEYAIVAAAYMIAAGDYDPRIDDDGDGNHPDCLYSYCLTATYHKPGADVLSCDTHVEFNNTNRWAAQARLLLVPLVRHNPAARCRWNNDH